MKNKILISLLIIPFFLTGCASKDTSAKDNNQDTGVIDNNDKPAIEKVDIVDVNSKTRPFAIMINNHNQARPNHVSLDKAYMVYEIIVEGGITRYLAVFKDQESDKVGSVRSARPYFLDYALENDAIYTHIGGSVDAFADIKSLGISDLDGMNSNIYFRDTSLNVATEHTAFVKLSTLKSVASSKGYNLETSKGLLLNYLTNDADLSKMEENKAANKVTIRYSDYGTTSYSYDAENKVYKRFVNNIAHTDGITKKQYTAKNIITYKVTDTTLDSYGRKAIDNIGTGTGYYITNGYAVPITWSKASRSAKTIYKFQNGEEINVSDGNTWIQIQPSRESLVIE